MDKWEGTWSAIEAALINAGINTTAIEAVRKATAHARHEGRKHAAYWAARRWLSHAFDFRKEYDVLDAYAYALCFAESVGLYGGSPRNAGTGTTRHPAFRNLGKGRRHATDGGAWTAAIAAVAAEASTDVTVDPDGRLAIFVFKNGARIYVPVSILLASEPEARRGFALYAAERGWRMMCTKMLIAAAREIEIAEKGEAIEPPPTVTREKIEVEDDGFWVEVEETDE